MTKIKMYVYYKEKSKEPTISPVRPKDVEYEVKYQLIADNGKKLTADGKNFYNSLLVSEEHVDLWREV